MSGCEMMTVSRNTTLMPHVPVSVLTSTVDVLWTFDYFTSIPYHDIYIT